MRAALYDPCQLPGQVGCVPQARVHALAEERRLQMRGVAGKEYPANLKAVGDPRVVKIDTGALDFRQGLVTRIMRTHQAFEIGRFQDFVVVLFQAHLEFQATIAIGQIDRNAGADRMAVNCGIRCVQLIVQYIHHQPFVGMCLALQLGADQVADGASSPIGAHGVRAFHRERVAGTVRGLQLHAVRRLYEPGHFDTQPDVNVVETRETLAQGGFGERLNEQVAPRPPERLRAWRHFGEAVALRVVVPRGYVLDHIGQYVLGQAHALP